MYFLSKMLFLLVIGNQWSTFATAASIEKNPLLIDASLEDLKKGLTRGAFSSADIVTAYIGRIREVNGALRPVLEINPDALAIAAVLDKERARGRIRGPMHGIPLLIKDLIATDDKMNTTAGSYALLGARVTGDATVIKKLRDAGAIILGKSAVSEWANVRSLNSSNGWSARSGQVTSPYVPQGDPSGSSSGSAVAVALGLSLGSLGTETDGSLVLPASYNNIVAIKPTVGLTSRHMVLPVSEHQDTIGPMAKTVKDAAYILQAIAGKDPHDNYTSAMPGKQPPNYVSACKDSSLKGLRIGVPRDILSLYSSDTTLPIIAAFEEALNKLRARGARIVDTNFPLAEEYLESNVASNVVCADYISNLAAYLTKLSSNPNKIYSLADLRAFTQRSKLEQFPQRDTGLWDIALLQGWNNTSPKFWTAYQQNLNYGTKGGLLGALKRDKLTAVVLPTEFAPHWAAGVGSPIVSVPLGSYPAGTPLIRNERGLVISGPNVPFGISFLGAPFAERTLIGLAYAFEQMTKARNGVKPYVSPSTEL